MHLSRTEDSLPTFGHANIAMAFDWLQPISTLHASNAPAKNRSKGDQLENGINRMQL